MRYTKKNVKNYKETEVGREAMCQIIEDVAESRAAEQALDAMGVSAEDKEAILKRL